MPETEPKRRHWTGPGIRLHRDATQIERDTRAATIKRIRREEARGTTDAGEPIKVPWCGRGEGVGMGLVELDRIAEALATLEVVA